MAVIYAIQRGWIKMGHESGQSQAVGGESLASVLRGR
jgi:hypothetical protein